MSQPPLTAAIRRLEEEVGATLIERGRKTVRLTAAGKVLLTEARRLLIAAGDALAATRDAAEGRRGHVRLSYVGSAMYGRLPQDMRLFRQMNSGVRIDLREMTTAMQIAALRADEIDLAIVIPPLSAADGLRIEPYDADRLAIALPRSHRLAASPDLKLSDIAGEQMVIWPRSQGPGFYDQVMRLCGEAGFAPCIVQEAHGMHAVLSLVAIEMGLAIVPASMASVRPGEISYRVLDGEAATFEILLCHRANIDNSAAALLAGVLRR